MNRMGPISKEAVAAVEKPLPRPPELVGSGFVTSGLMLLVAIVDVVATGAEVALPAPIATWVMAPGNAILDALVSQPRDLLGFLVTTDEGLAPVLVDIVVLVFVNVLVWIWPVHGLRRMLYALKARRRSRRMRDAEDEAMPEMRVGVAHDPYDDDLKRVLGDH